MKKLIVLLLSLAMVVTMLAACGQSGGSAATTAAPAGGDQTTAAPAQTEAGSGAAEETTAVEEQAHFVADDLLSNDVQPGDNMELTVGLVSDIGSMYAFGSATAAVKLKRQMCYEMLFWQDYNHEMHPMIGKSFEDKGNGTYEVEIFDYIHDSEGNKITTEDVLFSLEVYMNDGQNSSTFATLTDYHAIDDYHFSVTFDPERVGQHIAFFSNLQVFSKKAYEESGDEMASYPVGTGGYVLNKDQSVAGSVYVFDKYDDYWQTDEQYICDYNKHNLKKVTAKVITDESTLAVALQNGEIDLCLDIAANDWELFIDMDSLKSKDGYVVLEGVNNAFTQLRFNCGENSPCQDIKLRQAICYAIDAAACAEAAYGKMGYVCTAATNPGLGDVEPWMGDDGEYFGYDNAKAKELVEESSYNGETLRILVQPIKNVSVSAPLISAYCEAAGIHIELLEYDMAQYRTLRRDETGTEFDMELYGAAGAGDDYCHRSIMELDRRNFKSGVCQLYIVDDKMQELYETMADAAKSSPEAIDEYLYYVEEMAYDYGLYYCPKIFIGKDTIKHAGTAIYGDIIYGALVIEK